MTRMFRYAVDGWHGWAGVDRIEYPDKGRPMIVFTDGTRRPWDHDSTLQNAEDAVARGVWKEVFLYPVSQRLPLAD